MGEWNQWKEKDKKSPMAGIVKAKGMGEIGRLNIDNLSEEEKVQPAYLEIGMLYVSRQEGAVDPAFAPLFERLNQAQEKIQANKDTIAQRKGKPGEP